MIKALIFALGVLLNVGAWATDYTMASGSRPTCSGGSWSVSGSTYSCSGTISLSNGDSIAPVSPVIINGNISVTSGSFSLSNVTLNGNFTASNSLVLVLSANTTINGNVSSTNAAVSISGGTVTGNVTHGGGNGITLQNVQVGGSVTSNCCSVTIIGGSVAGNVSSSGGNGLVIQGGAVIGGNATSDCCSVTVNGSSVNGTVISNGGNGPTITNGSTVGNGVTSDCCSLIISGSTVSGTISTSGGNGIQISNSTIPSGSISASNVEIKISNSTIGSPSSIVNVTGNNEVTLSNGTSVYGNVTAGNWASALTIDSTSTVYGTCTSNSNSNINPPSYPRCNGGPGGATPVGFNAFETSTGSNAISGVIRTKVAGSGFTLAIVAIQNNARMTTFTGAVKVELVANNNVPGSAYGANNCPTGAFVLQTITTPNFSAGRTDSASFAAVANVYRDVRVRISYPATGTASVVVCSTDSFAIRPAVLAPLAQDADWTTAGTARTLNALTATATPYHKAGQPFRLALTASNAASPAAITSNYQATTLSVNSLSAVAPATVPGTLTVGTFSGSGTVASITASYSEVGAFSAVLSDRTFAQIDSADTAADCNGFWVCSDTFSVGRFVPDRFAISNVTFKPTCAATAFTYTGAPMALGFTLTAQNAAGSTTKNYAGTLAKLDPTTTTIWLQAVTGAGPNMALGAANVNASGVVSPLGYERLSVSSPLGSWASGASVITASVTFSRPAAPEAHYADFRLGLAPKDGDGVTLAATALNLDAELPSGVDRVQVGATAMRFGRLRLSNAFGSEKLPLRMPLQVQYWTGDVWVLNDLDSCTELKPEHFHLSSALSSVSTTPNPIKINGGNGGVVLTAPGAGNTGSVDVAANLGMSGSDQSCLATHGATAGLQPWLRSRNGGCAATYNRDPSARATFGIYSPESRRLIHVREFY